MMKLFDKDGDKHIDKKELREWITKSDKLVCVNFTHRKIE